eukprot:7361510-Prymnesium_polylepis.1
MAHWVTRRSVLSDEPPSAVCVWVVAWQVLAGCGPDFGIASFTAGSSSLFELWPRIVASPCSVSPRACVPYRCTAALKPFHARATKRTRADEP